MLRLITPGEPRPNRMPKGLVAGGGVSMEFERLNALFDAIYEGPMETTPWQTALRLLQQTFGAMHVTMILRPPSSQSAGFMLNTDSAAADATESYQSHFFALDPFVGLPEGQVITPEELVGASRWTESALYREYLRPMNVEHLVGADLRTQEGIECRFRISRSSDAPPFSDSDKALCRALLPHLKRAVRLHAQIDTLECERQLYAGTVNRMLLGTVSFAHNGDVIEVNPEARRILNEKDGMRLQGRTLCLDRNDEGRELQRIVRKVCSGAPVDPGLIEALSVTRPSGRMNLGVVVKPAPVSSWPHDSAQRPVAVMFLRDPECSGKASEEAIRRLFGLTRMEAALAQCLADGLTVEEAAEKLNVKRTTARTYLRFIFCKTGVTRQTKLVRTLLNSVVSLS
ncbi:helix-turn-helix transcriptional regulator [Solimonas sp. K1W22B-7]|uniref:helix-turn-helix transcriptional regulator n=1 Tax=Solimonas sp. K1W22B-7 TaxID=2303331 RepID=UPI0013C4C8D8|nr:helix-turn-helix transcriptional regulator [Solimonas sp. K1W22B-7]